MTNSIENNVVSTCTVSSSCSFGTENLPAKKRKEERNDGVPILPNTTAKRWDALFVSEEIIRINFGLHMHQPVEVILEVVGTKSTRFDKTCFRISVHAQIKIPVISICFPRIL
uniref:Uncharacterized protein n=1 Tax=Populus trichocarpa TaxID=3694 RepID=A0A2K1YL31_POPTR